MNFNVNDQELSISLDLDHDDPPAIDLTADNLGADCLTAAVAEMLLGFGNERAPDGRQWDHLAPATVRAKGHDAIGIRSGNMLAALNSGTTTVEPRRASWSFPNGPYFERAFFFHNGSATAPARPLIGWTADAQAECRRLIQTAAEQAEALQPLLMEIPT